MSDRFGIVGSVIAGKYRADRVIGEGGFGVVYAGVHLVVGNRVAIKILKPARGDDTARGVDAFLREARVLFDLAHPSIVRLYDVGVTPTRLGDAPYVVLELIEGAPFSEEVRRRQRGEAPPFGAPEIFAIFDAILDGLSAAHARGVAHRDLKPSNVMLARDPAGAWHPKILDFGTARVGAPGATVGTSGFTPLYAAPEQWDARFGPTGPATDVFAVGLLIAEAALLAPALAGDGMAQIAGAAMDASRRPILSARRPDLPRELDAVVLQATRPAPGERFADAAQLRGALRAAFGVTMPARAAPLAFTVAPQHVGAGAGPAYAPTTSSPAGPSGGPPPTPAGSAPPPPRLAAVTTGAPVQHTMTQAPASGPHVVSVVALIVGVLALGAVAAFAVFLVVYLRAEAAAEPAAVVTNAPAPVPAPSAPPSHTAGANPPPTAPPHPSPNAAADAGPAPSPTSPPAPSPPSPRPPAGEPTIIIGTSMTNYYDPNELKAIAAKNRGDLRACYVKTLSHDPKFSGTAEITVSNTLGATSCSFDVRKDDEATLLCSCLKTVVSSWSFPKANNPWGAALFEYQLFLAP